LKCDFLLNALVKGTSKKLVPSKTTKQLFFVVESKFSKQDCHCYIFPLGDFSYGCTAAEKKMAFFPNKNFTSGQPPPCRFPPGTGTTGGGAWYCFTPVANLSTP